MRWLAKSVVQNVIHLLPKEEVVNHFFQVRVSRRLPLDDGHLRKKAEDAGRHLAVIRDAGHELERIRAFEFGAGWDLVGPLCFWLAGVNDQTLVDIAPHTRLSLVNHTLQRLHHLAPELEQALGGSLRTLDPAPLTSLTDLRERFGISYLAPVDAAATGHPDATFDVVTTSDTLEHIPAAALPSILRECRRILKPDGIMSHLVDMMDHYRYIDPKITVYNFLQYSDRAWRLLNSPIEPQNRLRLPDYQAIFADAGLTILDQEVKEPTAKDLEWLARADLAERFRGYDLPSLGAKAVRITAVAAGAPAT